LRKNGAGFKEERFGCGGSKFFLHVRCAFEIDRGEVLAGD
jgi:hypothetical protein